MLKYTLTGFADEISPDLNVQMDVLDSLDIHHIEMRGVDGRNLCDYSLEEAKTVKKRMDERGFSLSAVGSPLGKIKITDPFEPHFEKFCHACDLAELFKVFGDSTRIRILYVLFQSELCVCDLAEALQMTQSAISHQLKILKQAKLVSGRREGKSVFYSLADDHVRLIIDQGREHIEE